MQLNGVFEVDKSETWTLLKFLWSDRLDTNETGPAVLEHQHSVEVVAGAGRTDVITEEEEEDEGCPTAQPQDVGCPTTQPQGEGCPTTQPQGEGCSTSDASPHTAGQTSCTTASTQQHTDTNFKQPQEPECQYTWRLDFCKTEPFWRGWFQGLSNRFLSCNVPKLLLLAGVDRLDKDPTIGQMQGKFQMQVLAKSGHAVHEDVPDQVADVFFSQKQDGHCNRKLPKAISWLVTIAASSVYH